MPSSEVKVSEQENQDRIRKAQIRAEILQIMREMAFNPFEAIERLKTYWNDHREFLERNCRTEEERRQFQHLTNLMSMYPQTPQ